MCLRGERGKKRARACEREREEHRGSGGSKRVCGGGEVRVSSSRGELSSGERGSSSALDVISEMRGVGEGWR